MARNGSLGSSIALPEAINTTRSLFLIYKYIKSFPLGPQRMQGHMEQEQANIQSMRGGLKGAAPFERGTPCKGHKAPWA